MNRPGESVTIHKCNSFGVEVWRWTATVLHVEAGAIQVEARYNAGEVDRAGLLLRSGDRFLETYFADRWYNVFAVHDGESQNLKGWYCNISRPARLGDGSIAWDDLGLDLVVLPDCTATVLDEDEFDALPLSDEERAVARAALAELRGHARTGTGPFAP